LFQEIRDNEVLSDMQCSVFTANHNGSTGFIGSVLKRPATEINCNCIDVKQHVNVYSEQERTAFNRSNCSDGHICSAIL